MGHKGKFTKQREKQKSNRLGLIFLILLLLFVLLIAIVVGFVWSKLDLIQYADELDQPTYGTVSPTEVIDQMIDISGLEQSSTEPKIPEADIQAEDHVCNILLIGTDERTREFSTNARSDSMILVSINKEKKTVKLVSLERGMGVPILEGDYEGQYDWLTHVFRYGGADLLTKTIEHCFRIEIDNYVRVNFTTVREVVDAIGGIEIDMTDTEAWYLNTVYQGNPNSNPTQGVLREGANHINGTTALHLAQLREIDSDWQRVERQRRVIAASIHALKGATVSELNNLLDQVLPLIQTDFTMLEIADWMLQAPGILLGIQMDQMTIPKEGTYGGMMGMGGRGLFAVDFETNSQILKDFLYGEAE